LLKLILINHTFKKGEPGEFIAADIREPLEAKGERGEQGPTGAIVMNKLIQLFELKF